MAAEGEGINVRALVADLAAHMPAKFRPVRGPVEARRALHDEIAGLERRRGHRLTESEVNRLFDELEAAAVELLGAEPAPPPPKPPAAEPARQPVDLGRLAESLGFIVGRCFETTFDGTRERAGQVARFARDQGVRWLDEQGLDREARNALLTWMDGEIERRMAEVVGPA